MYCNHETRGHRERGCSEVRSQRVETVITVKPGLKTTIPPPRQNTQHLTNRSRDGRWVLATGDRRSLCVCVYVCILCLCVLCVYLCLCVYGGCDNYRYVSETVYRGSVVLAGSTLRDEIRQGPVVTVKEVET